MAWIWFLFFLSSMSLAWYLGYRYSSLSKKKTALLSHDYLMGLNFVLNEETDKAVDLFTKMIELDSDTIDIQLAMANLFRKKGEIDRAIRIHQHLLARSKLPEGMREYVLYELGQDYFQIGLLDRAEKIFLELLIVPTHLERVHRALMLLYQQEKCWDKAIKASMLYEKHSGQAMSMQIAQYYCELAEQQKMTDHSSQVWVYVESALATDPHCVRAHLLAARLHQENDDDKSALRVLKKIASRHPDYLSVVLKKIAECYKKLNRHDRMILYFKRLMTDYPDLPIALMILSEWHEQQGDVLLFRQVTQYVLRHPSLRGLHGLAVLYLNTATGQLREDLVTFVDLMQAVLSKQAHFRCGACGFGSRMLYWQCPSCKEWCTLKPEQF